MIKTKKLVYISLLVAQAMVLNYLERFIPISIITAIPGAKLGLANIITMVSLKTLSIKNVLIVIFVRTLLSAVMFGSLSGYIYSLSGAILSFIIMALLTKNKKISLITISIFGAIFHNIGQLAAAAAVIENYRLITYYLPFLILIAIPTGLFVGACSKGLLSYLYRTNLYFKDK